MSAVQADLFGTSLSEAKASTMILARESKGTHCPCCTKYVKVYRRKFNSGMARTMVCAYRYFKHSPNEFIDLAHYMLTQLPSWIPSDYGKLVWWGLMEPSPEVPEEGKKYTGMYRMTEKGRLFVMNREMIPSYATEYMSKVEGFDGKYINIIDALGKHFDYYELMRSHP